MTTPGSLVWRLRASALSKGFADGVRGMRSREREVYGTLGMQEEYAKGYKLGQEACPWGT